MVLAIGALSVVPIQIVGDLFVGEVALVLVGGCLLLSRSASRSLALPGVGSTLVAMLVMLAGYMLTDLVRGSLPEQYLRGWGRTALFVLEFVAMCLLALPRPSRFLWFSAGYGLGGIAILALYHHVPIDHWKLFMVEGKFVPGYGDYVVVLFSALAGWLPGAVAAIGFGLLAVLSMAWDFRIHAAVCALTGMLLAWRGRASSPSVGSAGRHEGRRRIRARAIWPLALLLVGLAVVLRVGLMLTADPSSIERRGQSNVGRQFGLEVGIRTVLHSPLLGYGSWGRSAEVSAIQRDVLHDSADYAQVAGPDDGGLAVSVHSAILQVWVEAGVLGAAALLLLGWRLLAWMRVALVDRPFDRLTPVLTYSWIYALWNLVNSGFLGRSRLAFAIVGALVVMVMSERQRRHRRQRTVGSGPMARIAPPAGGVGR